MAPAAVVETTEVTSSVCDPRAALAGLAGRARVVLAGLDAGAVTARHAPALWDTCDELVRAFEGAKTLLARRVADAGVFKDSGARDTAEYLALRSGVSKSAMDQMLATSTRLPVLPATEAAVRRGELSTSQAAAIAGAAAGAAAGEEERLLAFAQGASLKELRDEAQRVRAAADPDPEGTRARQRRERHLRQGTGADGRWWFKGEGPPEDRARFEAALNPLIEEAFQQARSQGRKERRDTLAYDALQTLAHHTTTTNNNGDSGENSGAQGNDQDNEGPAGQGPAGQGPPGGNPGPTPRPTAPTAATPNPAHETNPAGSADPTGATPSAGPVDETAPTGPSNLADETNAADEIEPAGPTSGGRGVRSRRPNLSLLPLLRLDLPALHRGFVLPGELCEIIGHGPLTLPAAHDLLPDSITKLVLTHTGNVVTVTHIGRSPPNPKHLAILHTDITHHHTTTGLSEPTSEIPGHGPIPTRAARWLLGQLHGTDLLGQVLTRGVDVANLVHHGRQPTTAQKIALLWTQPTCSVTGCPHTFTQIDHRTDWHKTHTTNLHNLDRLCTHHHRLKTTRNFQLVTGTGKRALVPPTDPRHPDSRTQDPPQAA